MNGRIRLISFMIIFGALVMSLRLYFVQIVHGGSFVSEAERQYVNKNTLSYDRGEIYFESKVGELIPAAISRSGFTVAINPKIMKDPEKVFEDLNRVLPLDRDDFLAKASKKDDVYEEIAKHLNNKNS